MMKRLLLFTVSLFTAVELSAQSGSADMITADSVSVYGNRLALMTQRLEVTLLNSSSSPCEMPFFLLAENAQTGEHTVCADTTVRIGGVSATTLRLPFRLPEGHYRLQAAADAEGQTIWGDVQLTISPLRKLNFAATLSLDMLSTVNSQRFLYGNLLQGKVSVQNQDESYYGANGGTADDDGVVLWLEDADTHRCLFSQHLTSKLESMCSVATRFSNDLSSYAAGNYLLKVGYGTPTGLQPIDSLSFVRRSATSTYWTADGTVLPMPSATGHPMRVPAEAVAVDLRGIGRVNQVFTLDVSEANPNCLYYLDPTDARPEGLGNDCNVVCGLQAEHVQLSEDYDFFCPLAFTSAFVSFLMKPRYEGTYGQGYSETLVLPFKPDEVQLYDLNDESSTLYADLLKILRYDGHAADSLTVSALTDVRQMQAYTPYILGVYVNSRLLFMAENAVVPMTREAIARGHAYNMVGTTVSTTFALPTYQYDAQASAFVLGDSDCRLAPFRACIVAAEAETAGTDAAAEAKAYSQLFFSQGVWGPMGNPEDSDFQAAISHTSAAATAKTPRCAYLLTGQRRLLGTARGLCIIGGKKVIVR